MGSEQQRSAALQLFLDSIWDVASTDLFQEKGELRISAEETIFLLSFDIIAVVEAADRVAKFKDLTLSNLEGGSDTLKGKIVEICTSFIDLDSSVTQDQLNSFYQNFNSIVETVNQTLFPQL